MYMKKYFLLSIMFLAITTLTVNAASRDSGAKARLMTPEEIKSFEPGFGTEWHCEATGGTCTNQDMECCTFSGFMECENSAQEETCESSWCCWPLDPCNSTCTPDDDADCGRQEVIQCLSGECKKGGQVVGVFGGGKVHTGNFGSDCSDVSQCH